MIAKHVEATSLEVGPFFDDQHRALVEALLPAAESLQGEGADAASVAASMGQRHGLYQHLVPESGRVSARSLVLIRDLLGLCCPLGDAIFAVQGLGSFPIAMLGTDEQKQRYLPALRAGDRICGFGLTEPEAGSDVASMQSVATKTASGYRISGHKTFISNVGIADQYTVFANADPANGRAGITAFVVSANASGLEQKLQPMSIEHPIGELLMQDCEAELLGQVGDGFRCAMTTLDTFRISVGAAANGMATAALDDSIEHVLNRVQFGKPLSRQQLVQGYLAEMATELDAARLLVARAAYRKDRGGAQASKEVAMAKLFATEAAQGIVDKAVQLHGGKGVLLGSRVEALYRDIRPLRIYEGTSEIQKLIISRSLLRPA